MRYILALDQGTTSSRAMLFNRRGEVAAAAQEELPQILPGPGLVEHDPEAIWSSQLAVARRALEQSGVLPADVAALGVTNQRETAILWDRDTGRPVANAVVWQSRLSAGICQRMKAEGLEPVIREKTGLVLDAYFSASKIKHLLDLHPEFRAPAERGKILFGTVDTWLLWRLTAGRRHVTDLSNACRTLLLNIHTLDWDPELLKLFGVPRAMLPEVLPSSGSFGETDPKWFGRAIPITGVAGDQQAATFGQICFTPGSVKNTYGTGCFLLMNTGEKPVVSKNNLLTTIGWGRDGKMTYCLEGAVFIAGAVVQWLRDGLGVIRNSSEVEALAASVPDSGGVVFVPAFVGLGAPHWDPFARGAILGITRGTTIAHIARAALEAMAYQTGDVLHAMESDSGITLTELKVDGGAAANNLLMQFQADLLGVRVRRPRVVETTALGAAYLAGLAVDFWRDPSDVAGNWTLDREFSPHISSENRKTLSRRWHDAVRRSQGWAKQEET
ncbi:MAG: glycerol kinase GlpK [Pirellulales bacterium]|nr:glycerol kinase GlpK [Pirellulales bacterium]